jgi:hypothetical protein
MCSPLVCAIAKDRRFKASRDDRVLYTLRSHTTGVSQIYTCENTWVKLNEPSMYRHGLGTHGPKGQA